MSTGKHPQPGGGGAHGAAAATDRANFQGKYKWLRNEELEDYLTAIGRSTASQTNFSSNVKYSR